MLSWSFAAALGALAVLLALVPAGARRLVLAAASVVAVAAVWDVPVLAVLGATVAVWGIGRLLPRLEAAPRQAVLALAVVTVVAVLAWLKAGGGSTQTLVATSRLLGLSYFALKFIQHLVDAAAGRVGGVDLPAFVGVVFFPPTYPAGPIERSDEFARAVAQPAPRWEDVGAGMERIVFGLGKKLVLADPLLAWADPAFRDPSAASPFVLLLSVYAFTLGLYLDFGGYSDLAIGASRLLGVRVRENFDWPFLSPNLTLLWQRWHMSLTSWLRDYVFVPVARRVLRRTRRPVASQAIGQMATMVLCGLWHGVAWHFAAWGAYHGAGLAALAVWRGWRGPAPAPSAVRQALGTVATFHFFAFGLVLFACDLPGAARFLARLVGLG